MPRTSIILNCLGGKTKKKKKMKRNVRKKDKTFSQSVLKEFFESMFFQKFIALTTVNN